MTFSQKFWCFLGVHEYKTVRTGRFENTWGGEVYRSRTYYDLQCACCGKMKTRIL